MKLTHKLTLAFLLISLIAIGLAALFVWFTTATEFNNYLVDQRQMQFVAVATDYYRSHGNWRGVDTILRDQGLLPPFTPPGSPPPDPQPYALVDQSRDVIIPAGEYTLGQKLQQGVLDKGIGIEVGGVVVGTVLVTGQTPVRSPIEDKYLASVNQSLLIAALGGALIALVLGCFSHAPSLAPRANSPQPRGRWPAVICNNKSLCIPKTSWANWHRPSIR